MYLADMMKNLLAFKVRKPIAIPGMNRTRAWMSEIMDGYELYAFERSALLASSDIKLDRPEGMEAVAQIVFGKPRKIFMEANFDDRRACFRSVSPYYREGGETGLSIGDPVRIGTIIESFGGGMGKIHAVWNAPKSEMRRQMPKEMMQELGIHKDDYKFFETFMSLTFSSFHIAVDVTESKDIPLETFKDRLATGDSLARSIMDLVTSLPDTYSGDPIKRGWEVYRLNQITSVDIEDRSVHDLIEKYPETDVDIEAVMDALRGDLNGEIVYALAMSSLLYVDSVDVSHRPQPRAKRTHVQHARLEKSSLDDLMATKLGVVRMDLGVDEKLVFAARVSGETLSKPSSEDTKKRIRHLVRGHLFRARNGKIVYRKPHFRGAIIPDKVITTVRA